LEKKVEACYIEYTTQKVRKVAEIKAREKAEKRRLAKKENKRKQLEYL